MTVPLRTAAVVVAIVVVGLALFVARVFLARADGRPMPVSAVSSPGSVGGVVARASPSFASAGAPGPSPVASATAPTSGSGLGPPVVVDVVGQVRHPGVYTLRTGQRVADAVRAAGGVVPPSDVAAVNLARVLVDGEQIRVPKPGEAIATAPQPGGAGSSGGLVNLNVADAGALDGLPGVGPVLAQRIIDWRTAHGHFTSVDELGEVSGIGEKLLGQLRSRVSIS